MVLVGDLSLATFWIAAGLGLYALAIALGLTVYTPTLRRQIQAMEAGGPQSEAFQSLAKRGQAVGILLAVIVIAIVFLMVTKPTL
jgi:uncharacterized membrane protein